MAESAGSSASAPTPPTPIQAEPSTSKVPVGLPLDLPGRMGRGWTVAGMDAHGNVLLSKPSGNGISTIAIPPTVFEAVKKWRPNTRKHVVKKKVSATSFSLPEGGGLNVKGFDAAGGGNYLVEASDGRGGHAQKWISAGDMFKLATNVGEVAGAFMHGLGLSAAEPAKPEDAKKEAKANEPIKKERVKEQPVPPSNAAEAKAEFELTPEDVDEIEKLSIEQTKEGAFSASGSTSGDVKRAPRPRSAGGVVKGEATVSGSVSGGGAAGGVAASVSGTISAVGSVASKGVGAAQAVGTVSATATATAPSPAPAAPAEDISISQQRELMRQKQAERRSIEARGEARGGGVPAIPAAAAPAISLAAPLAPSGPSVGSAPNLTPEQTNQVRTFQKSLQGMPESDLASVSSSTSKKQQQAQAEIGTLQKELTSLTQQRDNVKASGDQSGAAGLDERIESTQGRLQSARREEALQSAKANAIQRQRSVMQGGEQTEPAAAPRPPGRIRVGQAQETAPSVPVVAAATPQSRPSAPSISVPSVSGPARPIKPPLGTQLSGEPSATEAERAASLGSAQQRERNAKPGGGETQQQMMSDEGGVGVLPTIPATYGAVPQEEKGIREKEREMKKTQEQLLGTEPEAGKAAAPEEAPPEEGRKRAPAAVLPGPTAVARQAASEAEEDTSIATAVSQQPAMAPGIKAAQLRLRSQKMLWLLSFVGIPLYALVGTGQIIHKIFGCPLGKEFDTQYRVDMIAIILDAVIALFIFGIIYFFIAIIAVFSI